MEHFYAAQDLAKLLGLRRETIYRKVKSGEIPALRIGGSLRFRARDIDEWLQKKSHEPVERWRNHLQRFTEILHDSWGGDLKSIVLFGSFASHQQRAESDIDLLLIADNFPKSRLQRQTMIFDLAKTISPTFAHKISPVLLLPSEALELKPLYLGILSSHEIIYDQGHFFQNILDRLKSTLTQHNAQEITDSHHSPYWVFPQSL